MLSIYTATCFSGMNGLGPGLTGMMKGIAIKVASTLGSMVMDKFPWPLPPRLDSTEAAFELSWDLSSSIDSYMGWSIMAVMAGNGNSSTILSIDVIMLLEELVRTDNNVKRQLSAIGYKICSY